MVMANLRKKVPAFDLTRRTKNVAAADTEGGTSSSSCVNNNVAGATPSASDSMNNNDTGQLDNRPSIPKASATTLFSPP